MTGKNKTKKNKPINPKRGKPQILTEVSLKNFDKMLEQLVRTRTTQKRKRLLVAAD